MNNHLIILAITLIASTAQADLQLTIQQADGGNSTISSNGNQARMDESQGSSYVVIDYNRRVFNMVDTERKQVMRMKLPKSDGSASTVSSVQIILQNMGNGPKVAGYSTRKYQLIANGKTCSTIFGSTDVLKKKGMRELMEAMNQFEQQSENMMGGMRSMMDDCTQANLQLAQSYPKTGAPLRILDENGQLESQVTHINTNKSLKTDYYQVPADYKLVNMQDQMKQAGQVMQSMEGGIPDMNAIMLQLQQSRQVTPEAMEQMKKMQEMLKQQYLQ